MQRVYENVTLNIVYNGKIIKLYCAPLKEIDDISKTELSKITFLKKLLSIGKIDKQEHKILSDIYDNIPEGFLLDDEYPIFDFFLNIRYGNKVVVIPVMYNQHSLNKKDIVKELQESNNLNSLLNMYYQKHEKDNINNSSIISSITSDQIITKKSNLTDEALAFESLDEEVKNGNWLNSSDYKYYKDLQSHIKSHIYHMNKRSELLSRLVTNLQSSYYKTRSLCMIRKLYDGELSEFSSIILNARDNSYDALRDVLSEYTLNKKKRL